MFDDVSTEGKEGLLQIFLSSGSKKSLKWYGALQVQNLFIFKQEKICASMVKSTERGWKG